MIGPLALGAASSSALADLDLKGKLSKEQLKALLQDMDSSVRALPATAQVRWAGSARAGQVLRQTGRPSVAWHVCSVCLF